MHFGVELFAFGWLHWWGISCWMFCWCSGWGPDLAVCSPIYTCEKRKNILHTKGFIININETLQASNFISSQEVFFFFSLLKLEFHLIIRAVTFLSEVPYILNINSCSFTFSLKSIFALCCWVFSIYVNQVLIFTLGCLSCLHDIKSCRLHSVSHPWLLCLH